MLKIPVRKLFTANDSVFGLPNVAVKVDGYCNHPEPVTDSAQVDYFAGEEDRSFIEHFVVCRNCGAVQDDCGVWVNETYAEACGE